MKFFMFQKRSSFSVLVFFICKINSYLTMSEPERLLQQRVWIPRSYSLALTSLVCTNLTSNFHHLHFFPAGEEETFLLPFKVISAGLMIKSTQDRLTKEKITKLNYICMNENPRDMRELETPHTQEVQKQKGKMRYIFKMRHSELRIR